MPTVSKGSATQGGEFGPVTDRSDQVEGYTRQLGSGHPPLHRFRLGLEWPVRGHPSGSRR
jgi:hypothetical protein